ncbi:MAG: hypothetical protein JW953_23815 [Anaerolineae bacterium]|nr:hypothetical protein [Anaerolineae bacterium]
MIWLRGCRSNNPLAPELVKIMHRSRRYVSFLLLWLIFTACAGNPQATPTVEPQKIQFSSGGVASLSIPSLNGNKIAMRVQKPAGDGPFPVLIGVAGGDGMYAFQSALPARLLEKGIITVDFAPQGRGESEGEDDHHGLVHQDDLKAIVDFVSGLSFVQKDNMGLLSYSYGVVLATGALARYPEMPVAFLIDWEGPSCPGKDLQRGLANDEAWAYALIRFLNKGREPAPEELSQIILHGGAIFDEGYWAERDASGFAADLPCPYLRVQFDQDHAQGSSKSQMIAIINAATINSGQWTRCNDNPPNIIYSEEELSRYHFHNYSGHERAGLSSVYSQSVDTVLLGYAEEMFFARPYESR